MPEEQVLSPEVLVLLAASLLTLLVRWVTLNARTPQLPSNASPLTSELAHFDNARKKKDVLISLVFLGALALAWLFVTEDNRSLARLFNLNGSASTVAERTP